jgi:hypothetical protein
MRPSTVLLDQAYLRPLLESVNSMAARLGVGPSKAWELVKERRVEVVYLDKRTLVVVESTNRLLDQLRAEASSRKPSTWAQRCGPLASAANKGRRQRPHARGEAR